MSKQRYNDVRRGVSKAGWNKEYRNIIINEIWIVSIVLGLIFQSWWVFGGALFGMVIIFMVVELAKIFILLASLFWAIVFGFIFSLIGGPPAAIIIGIFAFLASMGIHEFALQYFHDVIYEGEEPLHLPNPFSWFKLALEHPEYTVRKPDIRYIENIRKIRVLQNLVRQIEEKKNVIFEHPDLKKGLDSYLFIKEKFDKGELDDEFKETYLTFYRLNGAGLSEEFKKRYFEILSEKATNLKYVLLELYNAVSNERTPHKVHLSFASKLLHTVDNNNPIFDTNVCNVLGMKMKQIKDPDEKIEDRIRMHKELQKIYSETLFDSMVKKTISEFRSKFNLEESRISDVKILDFFLWILGKMDRRAEF